mgnify:FL=1|jgi:hypothetical protein
MENDLIQAIIVWGVFVAGIVIGVKHGYHRGEVAGSRRGFKRGIDVARQSQK